MKMAGGRASDYGAFKSRKASGRAARSRRDYDGLSIGVGVSEPVLKQAPRFGRLDATVEVGGLSRKVVAEKGVVATAIPLPGIDRN
jgi:hypothetical protein